MRPDVQPFFDINTGTMTYVVYEKAGSPAAIVDPVLDYDPKAARTSTRSADAVIAFVQEQRLGIEWILETHAHADHLSAAPYLKRALGGKIGVPGHTPADMAYEVDDAVFVGDTLFLPDVGTARCDFPGGDARTLYRSIQRLLALGPDTRLFVCHDYPPGSRAVQWQSTVREQRERNIHVGGSKSEDEFVAMREARDATLGMPTLILPAVQVNIRAGQFPDPAGNGTSYLKIPLNAF